MEDDSGCGIAWITLRCDCGAEGRAQHGERWVCPKCGRTYDTSQIPSEDYDAISRSTAAIAWRLVDRVRDGSDRARGGVTGAVLPIFAGLAVTMLSWFLYIKPVVHRRHRRAVSALTRQWNLEAEAE